MAQNLKTKSDRQTRPERLEAFQPLSGMVVPRFAGISTFMRLPYLAPTEAPGRIDIALLGRYYERIADHAVSLANRVVYVVTGEKSES